MDEWTACFDPFIARGFKKKMKRNWRKCQYKLVLFMSTHFCTFGILTTTELTFLWHHHRHAQVTFHIKSDFEMSCNIFINIWKCSTCNINFLRMKNPISTEVILWKACWVLWRRDFMRQQQQHGKTIIYYTHFQLVDVVSS